MDSPDGEGNLNMSIKSRALVTTALVASFLGGAAAYAQVDRIVVTAQKREQTLQDTPVAVTALTEETLEQAQIRDASDLQFLVPSLRVSQFASSTNTEFNIRGLGTSSFNPGLEPSVGVFVDGVYLPRQGAAINDFLSLERVEVIRGPQAVLYGRNTPAGVVNFITQEPEFEFGFDGEVTYGNYNATIFKGSVTGPIVGDSVAFRLDGVRNTRDGFIDNFDGRELNNRDRYSTRGQLLVNLSDDLSVRFIASYGEIDENCCAAPFSYFDPADLLAFGALGATLVGDPSNPDPWSGQTAIDGRVNTQLETKSVSAEVSWDLDGMTFTSITANQWYDEVQDIDADFSTIDLVQRRLIQDDYTAFTQEFRLQSTGDGPVDWTVGAFYYNNGLDHTNNTPFGADLRPFVDIATRLQFAQGSGTAATDALFGAFGLTAVHPSVGGPIFDSSGNITGGGALGLEGAPALLELLIASNAAAGNPAALQLAAQGTGGPLLGGGSYLGAGGGLVEEDYDYNTTSWSIFAQTDVHLTDRLTASVGLRYATEKKDIAARITLDDPFAELNFANIARDMRLVSAATCLNPTNYATCSYFIPTILFQGGAPFNPLVPLTDAQAANSLINPLLGLSAIQFNPNSPSFNGVREDDNVAGSIILSYDWSDNLNTYFSYATGFKPGGFNVSSNAALTGVIEFEDENAEAFEIGVKMSAFNNMANLNFALFDQTVEDFQSNNFVGSGFALQNAGEISIQGLEFDGIFAPTPQLVFAGGFSYLFEHSYTSFETGPCPDTDSATPHPSCFNDVNPLTGLPIRYNRLTGQDVAGTTDLTGSLTGTYTQPIGNGLEGFLRGEVYYTGDYSLVTTNDPRLHQDSFALFNASIGIGAENGAWGLQLWGKNLGEEEYAKGGFPSVGLPGVSMNIYPSDPSTYGLTLRVRH